MMQPENFETLITPPWPPVEESSVVQDSLQAKHNQAYLSKFGRNDESEDGLDHIVTLGYN